MFVCTLQDIKYTETGQSKWKNHATCFHSLCLDRFASIGPESYITAARAPLQHFTTAKKTRPQATDELVSGDSSTQKLSQTKSGLYMSARL